MTTPEESRNPAARPSPAAAPPSPVVVALDVAGAAAALALADRISPALAAVKVGKELFTAEGPALVRELVARGYRVFLDLKFHDIPNTVAQACAAATRLGVWMVNVHASGGSAMLRAARAAVDAAATELAAEPPLLVAVTVLTSLDDAGLREIGIDAGSAEQVMRLARLARDCGLDGVVCSAREAAALRAELGPAFRLVTPGIRPAGVDAHDQARVATPEAAIAAGATDLVIGRAITASRDPRTALEAILTALAGVEATRAEPPASLRGA